MTSRQRVLCALDHKEPDRIPIDFGGTVDSTIQAINYGNLRRYLKVSAVQIRVVDVFQQITLIDDDIKNCFGVDVEPLLYMPRKWRNGFLSDGSPAQLPFLFHPVQMDDGSSVLHNGEGQVIARMPKNGYYFDVIHAPLATATTPNDVKSFKAEIEAFDKPFFLDRSYEELAVEAKQLRKNSDRVIVGLFSGHLLQAGLILRGWEQFYIDLLINRELAHALLRMLVEANKIRFEQYARTVCPYVDVVMFEDDLGMEDRPLLSPELYRAMIKPYQKELFEFVKSHTDAPLLFHCDGAVAPLIPDFIEVGIDILNPVQVSAAGMDTGWLKKEFGRDICFWGAGCDSQRELPFGSRERVADEVKRRIDDLAAGGGFVFAPIHNVQNGVPPENIVTMFETALEYGKYD